MFSSVTRPPISHGLVVGKHPQNTLVRPLVHGSGFDRHGAVPSPLEPRAASLEAAEIAAAKTFNLNDWQRRRLLLRKDISLHTTSRAFATLSSSFRNGL
jgi:hypothetical protein